MLRQIHSKLIKNEKLRKYQYRLLSWVRQSLGVPDAYSDIFSWINAHDPVVVLDIGCYVGDTIARFAEETNAKIIGFEPTSDSYQVCSKRFAGQSNVEIHNLALGDTNGEVSFFINKNPQTNSLLNIVPEAINSFGESLKNISTSTVTKMKLDDWVAVNNCFGNKVVFVKADVQGAELMLLEGGKSFFKNYVGAFYSEVQIAPIYEEQADFATLNDLLVNKLGFRIKNIYPAMLDHNGYATQFDVLWIRGCLRSLG